MSAYSAMITIFVQDCNQISQSFYDSVINNLQFHQLTCSCGHSSCLSIHGYYQRSVKTPDGLLSLRLCRVICSECGHTHALLLSSIVPYSQIPFSVQHQVVSSYEAGSFPSSVCEEYLSIDENNVKYLIRSYRKRWREMLRSLSISLSPIIPLIRQCFLHYSAQFMQIHQGRHVLFSTTT